MTKEFANQQAPQAPKSQYTDFSQAWQQQSQMATRWQNNPQQSTPNWGAAQNAFTQTSQQPRVSQPNQDWKNPQIESLTNAVSWGRNQNAFTQTSQQPGIWQPNQDWKNPQIEGLTNAVSWGRNQNPLTQNFGQQPAPAWGQMPKPWGQMTYSHIENDQSQTRSHLGSQGWENMKNPQIKETQNTHKQNQPSYGKAVDTREMQSRQRDAQNQQQQEQKNTPNPLGYEAVDTREMQGRQRDAQNQLQQEQKNTPNPLDSKKANTEAPLKEGQIKGNIGGVEGVGEEGKAGVLIVNSSEKETSKAQTAKAEPLKAVDTREQQHEKEQEFEKNKATKESQSKQDGKDKDKINYNAVRPEEKEHDTKEQNKEQASKETDSKQNSKEQGSKSKFNSIKNLPDKAKDELSSIKDKFKSFMKKGSEKQNSDQDQKQASQKPEPKGMGR